MKKKKETGLLIEKKSPAEQAKVKKGIVKKVVKVFVKLAEGLVKIWHKNRSFIITKEDAIDITIDQLEQLVSEIKKEES